VEAAAQAAGALGQYGNQSNLNSGNFDADNQYRTNMSGAHGAYLNMQSIEGAKAAARQSGLNDTANMQNVLTSMLGPMGSLLGWGVSSLPAYKDAMANKYMPDVNSTVRSNAGGTIDPRTSPMSTWDEGIVNPRDALHPLNATAPPTPLPGVSDVRHMGLETEMASRGLSSDPNTRPPLLPTPNPSTGSLTDPVNGTQPPDVQTPSPSGVGGMI